MEIPIEMASLCSNYEYNALYELNNEISNKWKQMSISEFYYRLYNFLFSS